MPKLEIHARYVPAALCMNKRWYLDYKYQTSSGEMKRMRMYLDCAVKRLRTKTEKVAFALHECELLNEKLKNGWTPEVARAESENSRSTTPIKTVYEEYCAYLQKSERDGELRHDTMLTYRSTMTILEQFTTSVKMDIIYKFNDETVREWLQWAREERGVGRETQKNYKRWLRSFCAWCIEMRYMKENYASQVKLTDTVQQKRKNERKFNNKYIDAHTRARMFKWMEEHDRSLLLASYLCYYCFIRPHEIMQLCVDNIHLKDGQIFVPHDVSKNDTDGWVTLPDVVAALMVDMGVLSHPGSWRLFNRQLQPGPQIKADRGDALRDRWSIMRKALNLPDRIVMYNLKHTGITDMLGQVSSPRTVQLQARHHSLEQTEEYVQKVKPEANAEIKRIK